LTEPFHTCLIDVIDLAEDPAPQLWYVRGSNNIEQRNVDIIAQPTEPQLMANGPVSTTFSVGNPYSGDQLADVIIDASAAPTVSEVTLDLGGLFERWQKFGKGSLTGAAVLPGTTQITLPGGGQATIGGIPLAAEELVEVILEISGSEGQETWIDVSERIGGEVLGGVSVHLTGPVPAENTAPAFADLPDQVFDQNRLPPGTMDLWAYAWDAQTPTSGLSFAIEGTPPSAVDVTLTGNRFVTVNPNTDWCGYYDVTVRASDPEGLWSTGTFRVAVTWSCKGPLPVPDQAAAQDELITLDLTEYEPLIGDGSGMYWYVTRADHCTVSGERSEDDVLTFTPQAGFLGSDIVTLHMRYPRGSEATQELALTWQEAVVPPEFRLFLPLAVRGYP
jgi:hypothetical protein